MSEGRARRSRTRHPVDQRLPPGRLAAYGLQHVLAMYAGAVAVPLNLADAIGLNLVFNGSGGERPSPTVGVAHRTGEEAR